MATDQLITVQQAANRKGVGYHTVLRAIHSGRLPGRRLGHQLFITSADLEAWQPKRDRAPRKYRREPDLAAVASSLSLAALDRATLEGNVSGLATVLIRVVGSLSYSQLEDVRQYLSGIVLDSERAIISPSETTTAPAAGVEPEVMMETIDLDARQHHADLEPDGLVPMPTLQVDALAHASSLVGRQSQSIRSDRGESASERAQMRATAVSGLQSLRRELERLRAGQEPGHEALVWPGYRDVVQELVDLLHQAGEDVASFEPQSGARTAKTASARRGHQGIGIDHLLADVKRVQDSIASHTGPSESE